MSGLVQDLRIAIRVLVRRPGFALLTIFTLALGSGATTVIFTAVEFQEGGTPYTDTESSNTSLLRNSTGSMT